MKKILGALIAASLVPPAQAEDNLWFILDLINDACIEMKDAKFEPRRTNPADLLKALHQDAEYPKVTIKDLGSVIVDMNGRKVPVPMGKRVVFEFNEDGQKTYMSFYTRWGSCEAFRKTLKKNGYLPNLDDLR